MVGTPFVVCLSFFVLFHRGGPVRGPAQTLLTFSGYRTVSLETFVSLHVLHELFDVDLNVCQHLRLSLRTNSFFPSEVGEHYFGRVK